MRIMIGFLLLVATSLNGQIDHWESMINSSDIWSYHVGDDGPPGQAWETLGFNASSWSTGPGGFGYGDGDDLTQIEITPSVFLRKTWQIDDLDRIEAMILQADYDDAFIAFLNGEEIARAGSIPDGEIPEYDDFAANFTDPVLPDGGIPEQHLIPRSQWESLLVEGTNCLAVQVQNSANSSDLSSNVWLHVGVNDDSNIFGGVPNFFTPPLIIGSSNLPIIHLYDIGVIPDEPKVTGKMGVVDNGEEPNYFTDAFNHYDGFIGIETRGSTSQALFDKKSYSFETRNEDGSNNNVELLGMPSDNDWILNGPYSDKTLMRNVLAMEISRSMGNYASRTQFVELLINEEYQGVYVLMEKIKQGEDRVDVAELDVEDVDGDELTGGYIVKIDKFTGSSSDLWQSNYGNESGIPSTYQIEYPKEEDLQFIQKKYIEQHFEEFERRLLFEDLDDEVNGYRGIVDVSTFIDYLILSEIAKNVDAYRLSTFLFKDKNSNDGKISMGPVWDYNLAWGNANYCGGESEEGFMYDFYDLCPEDSWEVPFWWDRFLEDEVFTGMLRCRYETLRLDILSDEYLLEKINTYSDELEFAQKRNFTRWPILDQQVWPNPVVTGTYEEEVEYLSDFLMNRLEWLDQNLPGFCDPALGLLENGQNFSLFGQNERGGIFLKENVVGEVNISDVLGRQSILVSPQDLLNKWDDFAPGFYFYSINVDDRKYYGKLLR